MWSFFNVRSALALASLWPLSACDRPPESTAAWSAHGDVVNTSPACGKKPTASTGVRHVTVFGKQRSFSLVVPPTYDPAISLPLIYVLHGDGSSGARVRESFDIEGAAQGKALFIYPDGLNRNGSAWDLDSPAAKNADVAFFDATLAIVQSEYCVDLHRVFVAGFSNGAYMANQLACRRGDRIRAVASHSGGGPYEVAEATYDEHGEVVCKGKPVGSLVIHGTADGVVAPSEGQKSIDHWTQANHCSTPSAKGPCATYSSCANPVTVCKVPGLGHTVWPEAPKRAWRFFDSQR